MATVYRRVRALTSIEAAYVAGLVDGEGTITLSRRNRNKNRQLVVSISSTESELLEYVQHVVAAGKITHKRVYSERHTPSKTYQIQNRQALDLLKQIAPFLKSYKAGRAAWVLDNYLRLTPRNGRYSDQLKEERGNFIRRFFDLRPHGACGPAHPVA